MVKNFAMVLICILIPFVAHGLEPMPSNSQGDLQVTVFITDSTEFIKEWLQTPPSHAPTINRIKEAKRNQMVHAGFAITGFTKGFDSKVNFVVAIQVLAPDGSVLFQENKWAVHTKKVTRENGIIIAANLLDMEFGATDPTGNYKVLAFVTDNISGRRASGSATLEIK